MKTIVWTQYFHCVFSEIKTQTFENAFATSDTTGLFQRFDRSREYSALKWSATRLITARIIQIKCSESPGCMRDSVSRQLHQFRASKICASVE